jgi:2'-5' RNA ligase
MSECLRTFVAVKISLPPGLRTVLRQLRELGRAVKAVDSEMMHLTLKFLGDKPRPVLADVGQVVESIAKDYESFELELAGVGAFPDWRRPQVVWAGVTHAELLSEMASRLATELEPLGFPRERRAYHPHLTLARIKAKPPAELQEIAEAHKSTPFGRQTIDRVIWYQSELQSTGPVYTSIATILLGLPRA